MKPVFYLTSLSNGARLKLSKHVSQGGYILEKYKLGEMEQRFANLIWGNAPIKTRELIVLCADEFDWKRTTTYTMLKRLCDRDIFINENGEVKILLKKELNSIHILLLALESHNVSTLTAAGQLKC